MLISIQLWQLRSTSYYLNFNKKHEKSRYTNPFQMCAANSAFVLSYCLTLSKTKPKKIVANFRSSCRPLLLSIDWCITHPIIYCSFQTKIDQLEGIFERIFVINIRTSTINALTIAWKCKETVCSSSFAKKNIRNCSRHFCFHCVEKCISLLFPKSAVEQWERWEILDKLRWNGIRRIWKSVQCRWRKR